MAKTTKMKRGDTSPAFTATLRDGLGQPVDLAGASARFIMRSATFPRTVVVDAPATILAPESDGRVRYSWSAADTATAGGYDAELEVTFGSGEVETFPSDRHHRIIIRDDLD